MIIRTALALLLGNMLYINPAVSANAMPQPGAGNTSRNVTEYPAREGSTFRDCSNCPEIMVIPAGNFLMGSSKDDIERDLKEVPPIDKTAMIPFLTLGAADYMARETPQHPVHIDQPFGLGKYPVTVGEFTAFVEETGYESGGDCIFYVPGKHTYRTIAGSGWQNPGFDQSDRDPVVCVNFHDAEAYVAWLNSKINSKKDATPYQLPSEAEWEYAARAGTQTAYWWSDTIGLNNAVCGRCGSRWDGKKTAPVGSFSANLFGLYDMNGNVWEWTMDCQQNGYAGAPSDGSAWLDGKCEARDIRGGSWYGEPWTLQSAGRAISQVDNKTNHMGFRVARELSLPTVP